MKSGLMLIESPNKIKTISKHLSDFNIKIMATVGHIRELDEKKCHGLGFDEKTYSTYWRNDSLKKIKGKTTDIIDEINKSAKKYDEIYLSTDPDREGEAISWHIYSVLEDNHKHKCKRVSFNEITQDAIHAALKNPRDLDQRQVNSYLARKILDRGIGFKLSDFVRLMVGGVSAGRVQSIALRFLKDKHTEIESFVPDHWFHLHTTLETGHKLTLKSLNSNVKAKLKQDLKNGLINFAIEEEATKFKESLDQFYKLVSIEDPKLEYQKPPKVFKTSTMHSTAISKLHMSAAAVDATAQKLYEGVELDGEFISLITYPRTDREDVSDTFVREANTFIVNNFGDKYCNTKRKTTVKKVDKKNLVQGAHEGIRPTYINKTPKHLEGKIPEREFKLYKLIWLHAVSSLMSPAKYENTLYIFDNNGNEFVTNHKEEKFDGFKSLIRKYSWIEDKDDISFNDLVIDKKYKVNLSEVCRVDKTPPSPYNESSLIKALESKGIGRPSTYSHILNIVVKRAYAVKDSGKLLITPLGLSMSEFLEKYFPTIMEYDYTRKMEQDLDDISEDKLNWKEFLDKVFLLFNQELSLALGACDLCGSPLKIKDSRKSKNKFAGCSNFPDCKFIKQISLQSNGRKMLSENCPNCNHPLVQKKNKWNKEFISCSNFPTCKYIKQSEFVKKPSEPVGRSCPECSGDLLKKVSRWNKEFISCSNFPTCKYLESLDVPEFLTENCPECHNTLVKLIGKRNKPYIKCSNKECKYWRFIKD